MEMSNELKNYMEEHSEGVVLREVPDEILFEMLAKATECEANGKKGTAAFQDYFKLDMSYTTAYKEPEKRGYQNMWVRGGESYDVTTGCKIESPEVPVEVESFSMEEFCKMVLGKNKREVKRLYFKAYPEMFEELRRLCDMFPTGMKGTMEAVILETALNGVVTKFERLAKDVEEF